MKKSFINGYIQLTAETQKENHALLDLGTVEKLQRESPVKKKGYKQQRYKNCDKCGKPCKGNVGLGIHKRWSHKETPETPVALSRVAD